MWQYASSPQINVVLKNIKLFTPTLPKHDRSFVPPVRDEESETQRKAHAKRVRETRRSTQGVTLDEIKSAEQLVKKKAGNGTTDSPPSPKKEEPTPVENNTVCAKQNYILKPTKQGF